MRVVVPDGSTCTSWTCRSTRPGACGRSPLSRRRHPDRGRSAGARSSRTRSTPPAISPIHTARTARASTRSASRSITPRWSDRGTADCEVWLYRGAWQEWEPEQIHMAVPLSPAGAAAKDRRDLQARVAEGQGVVPGGRRAGVLAAGRAAEPRDRPALRPVGARRIRSDRGVRPDGTRGPPATPGRRRRSARSVRGRLNGGVRLPSCGGPRGRMQTDVRRTAGSCQRSWQGTTAGVRAGLGVGRTDVLRRRGRPARLRPDNSCGSFYLCAARPGRRS